MLLCYKVNGGLVAVVFIGNNWALWTGAALYLLPKLVATVDDSFPNSEALHRYLPRGILKVTFMMLVARWWGQLLTSNIDDAEKMLTFGFEFAAPLVGSLIF